MRVIAILMLAMVMVGCAGKASRDVCLPPLIKEEGIRTYAQYVEAVKKERKAYIEAMQAEKEKPAVFAVRELGKLPSEVSRRYAAELAEVLERRGGRRMPRMNVTAGTKTVSYEELAKVAALTYILAGEGSLWTVDTRGLVPRPTNMCPDMARVVVTHCPCDNTALEVTMWRLDFRPFGGSSTERRERKELTRQVLKRVLDERRAMNLTRILPVMFFDVSIGWWSNYLFTINDPSGHDCKNIFDAMGKTLERTVQCELPDRTQNGMPIRKMYEALLTYYTTDSEPWQKKIQEMDSQLMQIYPATAAMKAFCEAINRGDEEAVWEFAGDARFFVEEFYWRNVKDVIKKGELCATILGEGYDRIACEYVALMYSDWQNTKSEWKMRAVVSGPGGSSVKRLHLEPTEDGKAWKVMLIWPAKKGEKED